MVRNLFKKAVLVFSVFILTFVGLLIWHESYPKNKTCMGDGLYVEAHTPTFHAISFGGQVVVKGMLTKYQLRRAWAFGHLSLKNVSLDSLTGLLGDGDKEGYFWIDKRNGQLISGMSLSELLTLLSSKNEVLDEAQWVSPSFKERVCS